MSEDLPIQGRITNKAGRGDKPRYIRPVERQRMRPWLIAHLDSNDIPGLAWQSKREKVFRISWKHAANQCFNMQKDTNLFERWAVHTGRHHDSDHKRWKANFRCALNSLPDVVEHKDQGIKKGNNAFKVYRFLDEKETKANKESKGRRKKEPPDGDLEEEAGYKDHSYAEDQFEEGGEDPLTIPRLEHLNLSVSLRDSEKLRTLQGHLDDPNLQEILAAATASLAAGSDAVSLEKISIEQLSRLGELSMMKLEISSEGAEDNFMYAYLCSWCDKVFPSKIEIFKHFLMAHQAKLLAHETYAAGDGTEDGGPPPDPSDPKYQKLQKEIEVLEKEVFHTFQVPADEVENEEVVTITSTADAETQALDLSLKPKGYQPTKQEVALDLSMAGVKRHKSPKTVQPKSATKRRRSSLEIDYTVKFGNYGLAGMPRTKRQMSLHTRKKEEEEEKLAKKLSTETESAEVAEKPSEHSVEDLVHAEILMSLKTGAGDDAEESTDSTSTSSKGKKETPVSTKNKKGKVAQKKHLMNLERVIDDVAKGAAEQAAEKKAAGKNEKDKKSSDTKLKFKAFRCGLCLQRFNDSAVLKNHVEEHKRAEKASPIVRLKLDPVVPAEQPGYMYYRQVTPGKVQTIWKCQITNSTGPSNIYVCRICRMKFDSLAAIHEHQKVHVEEEESAPGADVGDEKEEKVDKDGEAVQYEIEVINDEPEAEDEEEKAEGITDKLKGEGEQELEEKHEEVEESSKDLDGKGEEDQEGDEQMELDTVENVVEIRVEEAVQQDGTETQLDAVDGDVGATNEKPITASTALEDEIDKQISEAMAKAKKEKLDRDTTVKEMDTDESDASNMKMPDFVNTEDMLDAQAEAEDVVTVVIADSNSSVEAIAAETDKAVGGKKTEVIVVSRVDEGTDEAELPDNTKVLQCNVPSFLEVSDSAEVYGMEERAEEEDKKEQEDENKALQFVNCGICNKQLKLAEIHAHLEDHDAETDNDSTLFEPCIICKKMISTKDSNEHLKSHSVFELSLAKNMLVHNQNQLKRQLVVHKMKESESETEPAAVKARDNIKMFVCNLCSKGFEDIGPLSDHVKQHIRTEPAPPPAKKVNQNSQKEGEGSFDGSGAEHRTVIRKRKTSKPGEKSEPAAAGKKAKFVGKDKAEAADAEEGVEIIVGIQQTQALANMDSEAKKNSILAAALNSAPKFPITIPRSAVSETSATSHLPTTVEEASSQQTSQTPSTGNLPTIMNLPQTVANELMASSAASVLASGSLPSVHNSTSPDELQNDTASASQDAALRDSLCVKFPLVLLKPGNDSETSKTDQSKADSNSTLISSSNSNSSAAESVSSLMKQNNMSVPVVLVRQEKELKLVPMSSVLGLGASGKVSDAAAGSFMKISGSAANSVVSLGKSGLNLGGLDFNVSSATTQGQGLPIASPLTKPPILYAPVTTHAMKPSSMPSSAPLQSTGSSTSAATTTAKFAPFPMQLFSNQSTQIRADDVSLKTSLQRQTSGGMNNVHTVDSVDVGVQVRSPAAGPREKKTESQNIIAQLLDAKRAKNEAQKAAQPVGVASFAAGQTVSTQGLVQALSVGSQGLIQAPTIGTQGMIPALVVSTQGLVQAPAAAVSSPGVLSAQTVSTQTQGLAIPQQVVLSRNQPMMQSLTTIPAMQGTAGMKLLSVDSSGNNPVLAAGQQPPLIIFKRAGTSGSTLELAATTKQAVDTLPTVLLANSTDKAVPAATPSKLGRPPLQGKSLIGPSSVQAMMGESTVGAMLTMPTSPVMTSPGVATSPLLSTGAVSQLQQPIITTIKQPSTPGATLPPGIPLQPNFVNMIMQQLLQAQAQAANQASGSSSTTSPSVSSPTARPTFNLVFAPPAGTTATTTVVPIPSVPVSPAVQTQAVVNQAPGQTSTPPANPSLMLVCKLCNQSLDSLALMGSHVCSKPAQIPTPMTMTMTLTKPASPLPQKKITIFRCSLCKDKTFTDYASYIQHARTHPEIQLKKENAAKPAGHFARSPQFICPICRDNFPEEDSMNVHVEEQHPDSKMECKYCERVCIGKAAYDLHVLYDHPYQCNKCLERFNNLGLLTAHVMLDFNQLPALTCNKCNLTFPSIESMETHVFAKHEGNNIFDCANEETRDTLYAYFQQTKSTCWCSCKTCDAGFRSTEAMMAHVQKIHFTKVVFTCGICKDFKMPHRSHLDGHVHFQQSLNDIQFCNQCSMLFPNKTVFNKHLLLHSGNVHATDQTISKLKSVLKDKVKSMDNSGEGSRLDGTASEHLLAAKVEPMHETTTATQQLSDLDHQLADDQDQIAAADAEMKLVGSGEQSFDVSGVHTDFSQVGNEFLNTYKVENSLGTGVDESNSEVDIARDEHKNIEVETLLCSECKLGPFRSKYQLKQHMVIKHLYPRNRTATSYYQHVIENLKRPKTFECGKCERRFERQTSLYRHQLSHGIKQYACQVADCDLKFSTVHLLRLHQGRCRQKSRRPFTRSRTTGQGGAGHGVGGGEKSGKLSTDMGEEKYTVANLLGNFANVYLCTVCDSDCVNMSGLQEHIVQEHSDKVEKCEKCSVAFVKDNDDSVHICAKEDDSGASGDGPTEKSRITGKKRRLYSCNVCNKSFFKLMKLSKHVWEHQEKKKGTHDTEPESLDASFDTDIDTIDRVGESEQTRNQDGGIQNSGQNLSDSDQGWFKCSVCKTVFKESADLFQHVKAHLSPTSAASLARNKLLHAQSVQGDPSQLPGASKEEGEEQERVHEESRVLNAVVCDQCKQIVYFEEGKLCDSVLNHSCSDTVQS